MHFTRWVYFFEQEDHNFAFILSLWEFSGLKLDGKVKKNNPKDKGTYVIAGTSHLHLKHVSW